MERQSLFCHCIILSTHDVCILVCFVLQRLLDCLSDVNAHQFYGAVFVTFLIMVRQWLETPQLNVDSHKKTNRTSADTETLICIRQI